MSRAAVRPMRIEVVYSPAPREVECVALELPEGATVAAALEAVVSPVFDRIANTFVDAFVQRAEQVYGPR